MFFKSFIHLVSLASLCLAAPTPNPESPPPEVANRPDGIEADSLHGWQFKDMKDKDWVPAVEAAPVWFFGSFGDRITPCMPESATMEKNGQTTANDGEWTPAFDDPGKDCRDPTPWDGARTETVSFPNYITYRHCGHDDTWRVTYSLYYARDSGHAHDWEWATVVWKRQRSGEDWWRRDAVVISFHGENFRRGFGEVDSSENDDEVKDGQSRKYQKHPHVYAGLYHHANFFDENTSFKAITHTDQEFRDDNWYYLPKKEDMRDGKEIKKEWNYGAATSSPEVLDDEGWMCHRW